MLKLDVEKTRAAILEAISNYPDDGDPAHRDYIDLMRRTAGIQADLAIFAMQEVERDLDDPQGAINRVAMTISTALFSQMVQVRSADDPQSTEPVHDLIHVYLDASSAVLHAHYNQIKDMPADAVVNSAGVARAVEVVRRDVGDA